MAELFSPFHKEGIGELLDKNRARRTTSAIWKIFAELNNPLSPKFANKHELSMSSLTSMEVRPRWITPSEISIITLHNLQMIRKPNSIIKY